MTLKFTDMFKPISSLARLMQGWESHGDLIGGRLAGLLWRDFEFLMIYKIVKGYFKLLIRLFYDL